MSAQKLVALVGGTGTLGGLIANALLSKPDVRVRLLVRPESRAKAVDLELRGAEIVEGDVGPGGEASLETLCAGAHTVISALQGGPDMIIDNQRRLLQAARSQGVRRFIPSDYTVDLFQLDEWDNVSSDWRRHFAEIADAERGEVEVVHVLNGCFMDRPILFGFLGAFDLEQGNVYLWGDGDQPVDLTTYADTARFVAEVAVDDNNLPNTIHLVGDVLTFTEIAKTYEEITGQHLTVVQQGSLADLDARIRQVQETNPQNQWAAIPLMAYRSILKGKLTPLHNDRYPQIQTMTLKEYLAHEVSLVDGSSP